MYIIINYSLTHTTHTYIYIFLFKSDSYPIPLGAIYQRLLDQGIPRIEGLQNFATPQQGQWHYSIPF